MAGGVATLVVDVALSRIDALAVIALAMDVPVTGAGTMDAHVRLPGGERAYVEIPRFGDPPPLAIDVVSDESEEAARTAALELRMLLSNTVGWEPRLTF
ncbi:hypothetical protein [Desertivibrio insolitus]|uniref:hypothetical protein n=1 Tax=Herbiconiux sp. SYSU D00978 TaxID=2812562 RepID=UPI001A96167E|nr:hypothetical protein [Herbiconiux sp. SYSU D00978]